MSGKKKVTLGIIIVLGACISLVFASRLLGINIPFVEFYHEEQHEKGNFFSIGIFVGNDPFHLHETGQIVNPVLTPDDITNVDSEFVADPFMIYANKHWYLFFEVMNKKSGQGDLGFATSDDAIKWKYQKIILDEPFHLSYPDVFFDGKDFYMIPETGVTKSVRLYKATDFPSQWKFEKTLMKGLNFLDPTIFKYKNKWWLFIETNPKGAGTLRLYYSDDIHGPWKEHPKSPIVKDDANISRPGGRVIFFNNKIFRVAQDDWPTYGNQLRIFEIDRLTTSEYNEHELHDIPVFGPKNSNKQVKIPHWRSEGMHQLDAHKISNGNWIACVDGVTRTKIFKQWVLKFSIPFTRTEIK